MAAPLPVPTTVIPSGTGSVPHAIPGSSYARLFLRSTRLSSVPGVRRISCSSNEPGLDPAAFSNVNRRNILVGLGGMYGGAVSLAGGADPLALAKPIEAPIIEKCGPADIPAGSKPTNCCPPTTSKLTDFNPRDLKYNALRMRPAAHLVNQEYIDKFSKAQELMRALPDDDPRSFKQQASVHCAYCNGAYHQVGFSNREVQIHFCWLFFPWHRWYLYFYEKILGKLIGDPNFAIPYWNWDSPDGMVMPSIFTSNKDSSLYDQYRNAKHVPPTVVDLDYAGTDPTSTDNEQEKRNLTIMYRQMVSNAKKPILFFGQPYREGSKPEPGAGSIETTPHNNIHRWCGDPTQPNGEDMGNLYSSGRDPLFYSHHTNVDRMWVLWKELGGKKRTDLTDSDWLNASFVFYDENADLVRVKVKDCLNPSDLGYHYQKVDLPWLTSKPTPRKKSSKASATVTKVFGLNKPALAASTKTVTATHVTFPVKLDKAVSTLVKRPRTGRSSSEKEEEEEVLLITDITFDKTKFIKFDVYVNDEHEDPSKPDKTEFAGSFVHVPHSHKKETRMTTALRVSITDLLDDLDFDDEEVVVSMVPRAGVGEVTVGGIEIEYVS
ncbi:hypothetical protein MLD38_027528 [Melastoma candidum]|uniref:Uncharacterized protein n=1 Tax=Melastoma candidum TaxID=119954 RepID=A0ACB9P225_9MYRT|nr:hypothetical protein MLD38_027528 [Melastoma candidum]